MILSLSAALPDHRRGLFTPWVLARRRHAVQSRSGPDPSALRPGLAGLRLLLAVMLLAGGQALHAASLEDIRALEDRITAAGVQTSVRVDCPANHAGYVQRDQRGRHHLVVCRNAVDLTDLDAVWEVMAHESTHIMQACAGGTVIADDHMPRTVRELRSMAPHYAKLIERGYPSVDQRLEAEAFWMELQTPATVIRLFETLCSGSPKPR